MGLGPPDPRRFARAIHQSGLSIYDPVEIGDPELWVPTLELQSLLDRSLRGVSLGGLPLRTRSKAVKERVCRALGYPVPVQFKKTKPRFPGQGFDTYIQKSDNLQVWNEQLSPNRRYVLVRLSAEDLITCVKVVTGAALALLDTTGTLTRKFQARCVPRRATAELVTPEDTAELQPLVRASVEIAATESPVGQPAAGLLLAIRSVFKSLRALVGASFPDTGYDQERNRGAQLHRLVCRALGYAVYRDTGQFPDVLHQLLEVKLQTSPTIDLGLARPDSAEALGIPKVGGRQIRYRDVRYAVFYALSDGGAVTLTHLFVTTGEGFFGRFPAFQGRELNRKLQIPLPAGFFGR